MERAFDVEGPVAIDVRLGAGSVEIDPALTGRVEVVLEAHDEEGRRLLESAARVELRQTGGGHELVVDVPGRKVGIAGLTLGFGSHGIDCRVRCPEGSALTVRTKSADVRARGPVGAADVATASGDVELREVHGDLTVKTASGDVEVRQVEGRAAIATASGDVGLGEVRGPVEAATASGDIRVATAAGDVRANTASGDAAVGCVAAGIVSANTASGDLSIGVRRGSRAYLDCSTVSGDARSDLDGDDTAADGDGPLVEIRARTVSGDIHITRAQEVHA